jgi:hypothetical protein
MSTFTHRVTVSKSWFSSSWRIKCSLCGTVARTDVSRSEARVLAYVHRTTGRK